jgi:hypothetical protein
MFEYEIAWLGVNLAAGLRFCCLSAAYLLPIYCLSAAHRRDSGDPSEPGSGSINGPCRVTDRLHQQHHASVPQVMKAHPR